MTSILTQDQEDILYMLTSEFLTPKKIADRRGTSVQAVYKIINKLKKKGILTRGFKFKGVEKTNQVKKYKKLLRLHNIQESVKILNTSKKYITLLKSSNKYELDNFTIILYEKNIQIFTGEQLNFYGYNTNECYFNAISYFKKLYIKIENDLGIDIDKNRRLNKKWVRQHIAETGSEIAKKANKDKKRIVLIDPEDNKQAIVTDNSFNLNELEFIHPIKAKQDTDRVLRHIQDMREKEDSLTLSQISDLYKEILSLHKEQAAGLLTVINLIKPPEIKKQDNNIRPTYIG